MYLRKDTFWSTSPKDGKKRKKNITVLGCDCCNKEFTTYDPQRINLALHFCSKACLYNFEKDCIICNKRFKINALNQVTCSSDCFREMRNGQARARHFIGPERNCKGCGKIYVRKDERNGFCTKSCASTFYVNNGTYDKWLEAGQRSIQKVTSKDHTEIFLNLKESFPNLNFEIERRVKGFLNYAYSFYIVDILIEELKLVIEYNGDYWHCNPVIYESNYYNKKSKMFAKEIWEKDDLKIKSLEQIGYTVLTIWENDYRGNKNNVMKSIKETINARTKKEEI